jgi:hypothetical protein
MTVKMTGQNNKTASTRPKLGNSCGGKKKASRHGRASAASVSRLAALSIW